MSINEPSDAKFYKTTSRVCASGQMDLGNRLQLKEWCDTAASSGGMFAINTEWKENQWWTTYEIWWPINDSELIAAAK